MQTGLGIRIGAALVLAGLCGAPAPAAAQTPAEELAREAEMQTGPAAGTPAAAAFSIRRVIAGPSAYLPRDEVEAVARGLERRGLTSADIAEVLAAFDGLYDARGIALAQAVVGGTSARDGRVEIAFVEARVGQLRPQGNLASPEIYRARIGLRPGDLADNRVLEDRLLRLAILTGIRADVAFSPGEQPGFTDVTIRLDEPPRRAVVVTLDSHGSAATGRFRATLAYSDASLSGRLDPFAASLTLAEGLASGALRYGFPLNDDGTSGFAALSAERSRNISGPEVRGRNALFELGLSHPLSITLDRQVILRGSVFAFDDRRSTAGVQTTRQSGGGVLLTAGLSQDLGNETRLGIEAGLRHVAWRDGVLGLSGLATTYLTADASLDMPLGSGTALSLRGGAQAVRGAEAPAQFRGSLTTASRVRGYPSGQLAGDAHVWASVQLRAHRPVSLGADLIAVPYGFVDAARGWDRTGGVTTLQGTAVSAGLGTGIGIGQKGSADLVLARPLRDLPGFTARGKWRLDASISARF